jgi:hypothetical protein
MAAPTRQPVVLVPLAASLESSTPDLGLAMDKLPPATQARDGCPLALTTATAHFHQSQLVGITLIRPYKSIDW